jgi:peptide/nickel transport system permease protein
MRRYALQRLATTIPILIGVSVVTFVLIKLVPGDPATAILGPAASNPTALAAVRQEMGLDKPLIVQYWIWLSHVAVGDLGQSSQFRVPVMSVMPQKVANTVILTAGSLAWAVVLGLGVGIVGAVRRGSIADRLLMFLALTSASAPVFWIGILLSYVFSIQLHLLPALGMTSATEQATPLTVLSHLILPSLANSMISLAVIARVVRSTLLDALEQPYILAARARGMSTRRMVVRHAFRNVLPDAINITGLQVGYLFGGALFTEVVFSWPGIGSLIYSSIQARDYVMLQGAVLVVSAVFIAVNFVSDAARVALDPRAQPA